MKKNKSIVPGDVTFCCFNCGSYDTIQEHHIYGGSVKHTADKLGLVVHLCLQCHTLLHSSDPKGIELKQSLHRHGQRIYEEQIGSRQDFINDFIRSYL